MIIGIIGFRGRKKSRPVDPISSALQPKKHSALQKQHQLQKSKKSLMGIKGRRQLL